MDVTELGIVMEVRSEQPLNVLSPMDVTELGIVMCLMPYKLRSNDSLMYVIESGNETEIGQCIKASFSITFTELGIVMEVRLLQL